MFPNQAATQVMTKIVGMVGVMGTSNMMEVVGAIRVVDIIGVAETREEVRGKSG
jgi:hypothetical protein